uniref:HAT C-terminal dimerisation domain-containing protein n=1 Tax=Lactuca sativa TaxID=4236 RepID=A0A9R1VEX7_LACSA|nr:hypothetical protein LSAT_V11C500237630 [Lactuca sativa]
MAKTDANFVHCPGSQEWSKIENFCKFLQVFHEVTLAFSGSKYPTTNLYFPNVLKIRLLLKDEMVSNDDFLKTMTTRMNLKFDKYWSKFSTIMGIAVIFDPRYKFQVIDWAFKKDFDEFSSYEFTTDGKSELELYLEEPKLSQIGDLNVLEYWKPLQGRFPIVSQMARDILVIPISTVASGSIFSIGGRVLMLIRAH